MLASWAPAEALHVGAAEGVGGGLLDAGGEVVLSRRPAAEGRRGQRAVQPPAMNATGRGLRNLLRLPAPKLRDVGPLRLGPDLEVPQDTSPARWNFSPSDLSGGRGCLHFGPICSFGTRWRLDPA